MPSDTILPVRFAAKDILSAQRMRFAASTRIRVIVGLWLALEAALLLQLAFPALLPELHLATWSFVVEIALAFVVVIALFFWLAPWLDFVQNPTWKTPFSLRLADDALVLSVEGQGRGTSIAWERIRRVQQNRRAYILYLSSESNFLIIPKATFPDAKAHGRFLKLLATKSALPERMKQLLKGNA